MRYVGLYVKVARQTNALRRIVKYIPNECSLNLYQAFISSNFNYCDIVWHFCSNGSTKWKRFTRMRSTEVRKLIGNMVQKIFFRKTYFFSARNIFLRKKYIFLRKKYVFSARNKFFSARNKFFSARNIFFRKKYFFPQKIFFSARNIFFSARNIFFSARNIFFPQEIYFSARNIFFSARNIFLRKKYFCSDWPNWLHNHLLSPAQTPKASGRQQQCPSLSFIRYRPAGPATLLSSRPAWKVPGPTNCFLNRAVANV